MTVKRGPKWPWFSALRGPESGLAGKMKQIEAPNRGTKSRHQIEAPNRGQNPKEYPRNLGNPPLPRARVRARFIGEKLGLTPASLCCIRQAALVEIPSRRPSSMLDRPFLP